MLADKTGQRVPEVVFHTRQNNDWVDVSSSELFNGKTVIVFSLPGAFTPTCSSTHVPRYNQLAETFKAHGVDDIICMSVNDTFVMNEWKLDQKAENVNFIPDGNGDFSEGMGLLVDKDDLGFGKRSWRYSMLVKDGVIDKMFIEDENVPGDPFEVSDADTMLSYIAPNAEKPLDVVVFSREGCPFCAQAKGMLRDKGIKFDALTLNKDYGNTALRAVAGTDMVPQVFVNGAHIGGADALSEYLAGK